MCIALYGRLRAGPWWCARAQTGNVRRGAIEIEGCVVCTYRGNTATVFSMESPRSNASSAPQRARLHCDDGSRHVQKATQAKIRRSSFTVKAPMSKPSVDEIEVERLAELRSRAAARLAGEAATKGATARAADALSVLHALASTPTTASDALALLHELQVHQVEVDLQAQELRESRAELEAALGRLVELYDHQPAGCFTIDARMVLQELNQTASDMLGVARDDAVGSHLDTYICAGSAHRFRSAVSCIDAETRQTTCLLKLCPQDGQERTVLFSIGMDPVAERYIVNMMVAAGESGQASGKS